MFTNNTALLYFRISEYQSNENRKEYLFRICYSKGVSHHHLCLAENQANFCRGKAAVKNKGFRCILTGGCWHEEAGGWPASTRYLM